MFLTITGAFISNTGFYIHVSLFLPDGRRYGRPAIYNETAARQTEISVKSKRRCCKSADSFIRGSSFPLKENWSNFCFRPLKSQLLFLQENQ